MYYVIRYFCVISSGQCDNGKLRLLHGPDKKKIVFFFLFLKNIEQQTFSRFVSELISVVIPFRSLTKGVI